MPSTQSQFLEDTEFEDYDIFFDNEYSNINGELKFSFSVLFPLSFVNSTEPLDVSLDVLISSHQNMSRKIQDDMLKHYEYYYSRNWKKGSDKFKFLPNEFEKRNNLYGTNNTFHLSCHSALSKTIKTIDLKAFREARFEIYKHVFALDNTSDFNILPTELKYRLVLEAIDYLIPLFEKP